MGLLGPVVLLCLLFGGTSALFFIMAVPSGLVHSTEAETLTGGSIGVSRVFLKTVGMVVSPGEMARGDQGEVGSGGKCTPRRKATANLAPSTGLEATKGCRREPTSFQLAQEACENKGNPHLKGNREASRGSPQALLLLNQSDPNGEELSMPVDTPSLLPPSEIGA